MAPSIYCGLASDVDTVIVDGKIMIEGRRHARHDQRDVREAAHRR